MFVAVSAATALTAMLTVLSITAAPLPVLAFSTSVPPVALRARFCTPAVPALPARGATPAVTALNWTSASFTATWRVRLEKAPGTSAVTALVLEPRKLNSNGSTSVPMPVTLTVLLPVITSNAALMFAAVCVALAVTAIGPVDTGVMWVTSAYFRVNVPALAPLGSTSCCTASPVPPFCCTLGLSRSDDVLKSWP